jgi:hypothetical protein
VAPEVPTALRTISRTAGWLVVVLSLLSKKTETLPFPVTMNPLLLVGVSIQPPTTLVASTAMYWFAVTETPLATDSPMAGVFRPVTPDSVQAPFAPDTLTVPAVPSLFTKRYRVALAILALVVPAGSCVVSNCTSAWLDEPPPTFSVAVDPKLVPFPGLTNAS